MGGWEWSSAAHPPPGHLTVSGPLCREFLRPPPPGRAGGSGGTTGSARCTAPPARTRARRPPTLTASSRNGVKGCAACPGTKSCQNKKHCFPDTYFEQTDGPRREGKSFVAPSPQNALPERVVGGEVLCWGERVERCLDSRSDKGMALAFGGGCHLGGVKVEGRGWGPLRLGEEGGGVGPARGRTERARLWRMMAEGLVAFPSTSSITSAENSPLAGTAPDPHPRGLREQAPKGGRGSTLRGPQRLLATRPPGTRRRETDGANTTLRGNCARKSADGL